MLEKPAALRDPLLGAQQVAGNNGFANNTDPLCELPEVGLDSPCTQQFRAFRSVGFQQQLACPGNDCNACRLSMCMPGHLLLELQHS